MSQIIFVFNITYHAELSRLKNVLSEMQLLLKPDREHGNVLEKIKGSCRSCGCTTIVCKIYLEFIRFHRKSWFEVIG